MFIDLANLFLFVVFAVVLFKIIDGDASED